MGTRLDLMPRYINAKDHPHAYGDKICSSSSFSTLSGSSPRVWGQDNDGEWYLGVPRIIPTRMGTSTHTRLGIPDCADHPHAYGDKGRVTR